MKHLPLFTAVAAALLAPPLAWAQAHPEHGHQQERVKALEELVVTASPLRGTADDLARPVEVLAGEALDAAKANSLGETLESLPGVQSAYFGPGVGRPIIRGLEGARVNVLSGGLSSQDASAVSADHAVSIEPFLADQIEVLKGPATLLYGSSAIGGAVNVVDGRIPETLPDRPISGRAELRGNTVDDERTGVLRLDGRRGAVAFHVDLLRRLTDDVEIPGYAESAELLAEEGETPDPDGFGWLANSALSTSGAALGASWIGERGFVGVSVSRYATQYGIPGHAHEHEQDEDDHDDEDRDEHHGEGGVRIDLTQRRTELKAELADPFAGHDSIRFHLGRADYRHAELEGDQIGTVFENDGLEGRLELVHAEFAGWTGAWGVQYDRRDFAAIGDEAFVPASLTRGLGLFVLEQREFGRLGLELGARADRVRVAPDDADSRSFDTRSVSAAGRWALIDDLHLLVGLDRAERAPTAEELFSNGPHLATGGFELGDDSLDSEVANRAELGLHWHNQRIDAKAAVYRTEFDDFIYLDETGSELEELPVRQWRQGDARFTGIEAEARLRLADNASGQWQWRLFGDRVRARLDDGADLPRIPAARIGSAIEWNRGPWRSRLGAVRYGSQHDVAEFERPSDGYTLVDAHLSYHWDVGDIGWEAFLDGRNLTDREARPHTSFLRDLAPLPGRAIAFGVRAFF